MNTEQPMKTYAESQGEAPLDWNHWLDEAIRKEPSEYERDEAAELALGWVTCACGNLCDSIPRDGCGAPRDAQLYYEGCEFSDLIESGEWKQAKTTLVGIEARSAFLLSQMAGEIDIHPATE